MVADYPLSDQVEGATEFVQLTSTMPGHDFPIDVDFHCIVSLNLTTSDYKTWTEGPSLITGRGVKQKEKTNYF